MADEENEEPKKKSGLVKILIFVFAGILLIAVGLGGGFLIFGNTYSKKNPVKQHIPIVSK